MLLFEPLQTAWRNVVLESRAGDVCRRSPRKPFLHMPNLLTCEHSAPQEFLLRPEYTLKKSLPNRNARSDAVEVLSGRTKPTSNHLPYVTVLLFPGSLKNPFAA